MPSDLSKITRFFTTDPEELIALKRRVMGDVLPIYRYFANAIYCVGGTMDTQDQDIAVGASLWRTMHAPYIGILRATTEYGYCGFEFGRQGLIRRGVRETAIIPIDIFPDNDNQVQVNTRTEMKALVHHARIKRWNTIIVCAPYFHQIRASSTLISLLDIEDPDILIFNQPASPPNFREKMKHSQGVVQGDLLELLISEFGRLFRYYNDEQYPIRSCRELLAYYEHRDKMFS